MEKKQLYGILVISVLAVSGVALYLYFSSSAADDDLTGLPEGTAPEGLLMVHDLNGDLVVNISISTLVEMLQNDTLPLIESTSDETGNLAGFNPLDLFNLYNLNFVDEFQLVASDGHAESVDYETFYMGDPNYYKDAISDYSMLALAINQTWLSDIDAELGNLRAYGALLSSGQKVRDIVNITIESELLVDVYLNDELQFSLSNENMTTLSTLNYTEYAWGYKDNSSGTEWSRDSLNGTTIASIANYASILSYNVSFISIDGWGSRWVYNQTQMEDGLTGKMINDPEEELDNEGKQTMLNIAEDGEFLTYADGPFRIIMPGQTRDRYQKAVVEIRFTT